MLDVPYASVVSRIIIAINLWSSEKDLIALIISYFTQSTHFSCNLALNTCLENTATDLQFHWSCSLLLPWLNFRGAERSQMLGWETSKAGVGGVGTNVSGRVHTWEYEAATRIHAHFWIYYQQNSFILPVLKDASEEYRCQVSHRRQTLGICPVWIPQAPSLDAATIPMVNTTWRALRVPQQWTRFENTQS